MKAAHHALPVTSSTIERVIVPTNESEVAELALGYALDAFPNGTITVLTVVGEPSATFGGAAAIALADDPGKPADEYAQPVLDRAREIAEEYGAEIDTEVKTGLPVRGIINRAGDFDTVVIGRHAGSSSDRLFVGDVAEEGI